MSRLLEQQNHFLELLCTASAYASVNILDTSFTLFIMTRYVVLNAMVLDFVARGKMFSVMITTVTSLGK
jgi:hypothetical protein